MRVTPQPLTEPQKRYLRKLKGIKAPWSVDKPVTNAKPKAREFLTCVREDYQPPKLRGRSGTRLSPEKRAMVKSRLADRREFFAALGVKI